MSVDSTANNVAELFEARLTAIEAAVARLSSLLDPGFAVASIAAPVATAWLKETAQHDYTAKFFALLDVGEALLKYTTAIAFAAVIEDQSSALTDVTDLLKQPPTLGKLIEAFRKILDAGSTDWPVGALRSVFRRANNKATPTARYLLEEFISIRNAERGHGAQQPEGHYEELYLKNYLVIQDCVHDCRFLQLPLLHIHSIDHLGQQYAYRTTLLMGGSSTRSRDALVTSVKMRVGSVCLWDGGPQVLPLHQFVTYRYCTTCGLEHVFIAERITADKVFYHSHIGNHRLEVERSIQ